MLLNKQGKHPIHIGPMQVQHRKLKQSYQYFGSALKRFNPKISELKIYGTDNEKNLTHASAVEIPIATNLQWFPPFKKCIERRLSGWSSKEKPKVFHLIFKHFMMQATFFDLTAQKMKFSINDFFSECDQICRKLPIWSHLLKKSLIENFIFCAVTLICTVN